MKIIGCVIVIVSSSYIGFIMSKKEAKKLSIIEEIYRFVQRLENGVAQRLTLNEIACGYMSIEKPENLTGNSRVEILKSLSDIEKSGLCKEETAICKELMHSIGKSTDGAEIRRKCSEAIDAIKESLSNEKKEYLQKKRLYLKLGAVLGVLACVIVI